MKGYHQAHSKNGGRSWHNRIFLSSSRAQIFCFNPRFPRLWKEAPVAVALLDQKSYILLWRNLSFAKEAEEEIGKVCAPLLPCFGCRGVKTANQPKRKQGRLKCSTFLLPFQLALSSPSSPTLAFLGGRRKTFCDSNNYYGNQIERKLNCRLGSRFFLELQGAEDFGAADLELLRFHLVLLPNLCP